MSRELKNGTELILLLDLTMATMDEYNFKGRPKQLANLLKKEIEPRVNSVVDEMMIRDEEFYNNAVKKKERMILQMASLNEADNILLSEFIDKFVKNINIARKKGVVFFDKLL